MFTKRGLLLLVFLLISYRVILPISSLFNEIFMNAVQVLHIGLTLITTAVLIKVFLIVFPNKENEKDRFIFMGINTWANIYIPIGIFLSLLWLIIK